MAIPDKRSIVSLTASQALYTQTQPYLKPIGAKPILGQRTMPTFMQHSVSEPLTLYPESVILSNKSS